MYQSRYDYHGRNGEACTGNQRRNSGWDGRDSSTAWREHQYGQRQERRYTAEYDRTVTEYSDSPIDDSHFRSQRPRHKADNDVSVHTDTSVSPKRLSIPSPDLTTKTNQPLISPTIYPMLPTQISPCPTSKMDNSIEPSLVAEADSAMKTPDPSLNRQYQNDMIQLNKSSTTMSTEKQLEYPLEELATAFCAFSEGQRELKAIGVHLMKLETNMRTAEERFPSNSQNKYTNALNLEARAVRDQIDLKEGQINTLRTNTTEIALQALSAFFESKFDSRIKDLEQKFDEGQQSSKLLIQSNELMQHEFKRLGTTVENLQKVITSMTQEAAEQKADIEGMKQEIREFEHNAKSIVHKEIKALHDQVTDQKLTLARLNDVFVSKNTLAELNTRVKSLDQRMVSLPTQAQVSLDNCITRDDLQKYIAIFNVFEKRTEERFIRLEARPMVTSEDVDKLAQIADLSKRVEFLLAENDHQTQMKGKLDSLDINVQNLSSKLDSCVAADSKMQASMKTSAQRLRQLVRRTETLEGRDVTTLGISSQLGEKLQQDISSMQEMSKKLDLVQTANTHSINSLNQRFNNLSTDQLYHRIVSVLDPFLTKIKPQIARMQSEVKDVRTQQNNFKELEKRLMDADQELKDKMCELGLSVNKAFTLSNATTGNVVHVQTDLEELRSEYSNRCQDIQTRLDFIRTEMSNHRDSQQTAMNETCNALEDMIRTKSREAGDLVGALKENMNEIATGQNLLLTQAKEEFSSSVAAVELTFNRVLKDGFDACDKAREEAFRSLNQEQQKRFDDLVAQNKGARDSIDARLVSMEEKVAEMDHAKSDLAQEIEHLHQKLNPAVSTTPAPPHEVRSENPAASSPSSRKSVHKQANQLKSSSVSSSTSSQQKPFHTKTFINCFPAQNTSDDDSDTIDATPTAHKVVRTVTEDPEIQTISDSDNSIDLNKWSSAERSCLFSDSTKRSTSAGSSKGCKTRGVPTSDRSISVSKRKREQTNTRATSNQTSNDNIRASAGSKKARKCTLE